MAGRSPCFSMALIAYLLTGMPKAVSQQMVNVGISVKPSAASDIPVKAAPARLKMLVSNQAGVVMKTLEEGERITSRIFRAAGIELEWLDGTEHSVSEADYFLRIHCCYNKLKSTLPDRTVAFAPAGGRHITVFWDRITVESMAGSHSEGMVLGCVMAHELGHLLLPPGYHSPYGIMQGRLHYEDLSQARKLGNLFFAEEEAARMQARLKARPTDNQLSQAPEMRKKLDPDLNPSKKSNRSSRGHKRYGRSPIIYYGSNSRGCSEDSNEFYHTTHCPALRGTDVASPMPISKTRVFAGSPIEKPHRTR